MGKRFISIMLVTALLVSAAATSVSAAQGEPDSGTSASDTIGVKIQTPLITAVLPTQSGFKINWAALSGAAKYRLLYKTGNSDWNTLADLTATEYVHENLNNNTEYTYTVAAFDENDEELNDYTSDGTTYKFLQSPEITSVASIYGGLKIIWKKTEGAAKYRLYVKNGSAWKQLTDTTDTSYTDKSVTSGQSYTYTVQCISADGKTAASAYSATGKTALYVKAPEITKIENISGGAKITWTKVNGAVKYRLLVKNGSTWAKIGDTSGTSLTHAKLNNNKNYTYTVAAIDNNGKYLSAYDPQGTSNKYVSAPVISNVKNVYTGLNITWKKVAGVKKYRVYVKNGSSWKKLADTTALSYTDKSVKSGKTYTYKIRCLSSDGKTLLSTYSAKAVSAKYVKAAKISKMQNTSEGTKITWTKVTGAVTYRLMVKNGSSWKKVGDTKSLSLVHKGLKNNRSYTYTVRALDKNGKDISGYNLQGWSNTYLKAPTVTSVKNVYGGLKVSWTKVTGAKKYRLYVKNGSSWKKVGDTTSSSFTDKNVKTGKTYTYKVRCISANGKTVTSAYSKKALSAKYVQAPKITSKTNLANSTKITWTKVQGISKYRIYIKSGNSWKKLADTTETSYIHKKLSSGKTYKYTVRSLNLDGSVASGYNSAGWSNLFISPRSVASVSKTSRGVLLKWNSVKGAAKYRVYRKTFGSTSWTKIADVKGTSYTDTSAPQNMPYTYTIRCLDKNGSKISYFNNNTKYYFKGVLANGNISISGNTYHFTNGIIRQGYITINGGKYYYNSKGILQTNGIVGSKKDGFCYADENGRIRTNFTGIVKASNGYWYCKKGKIDLEYRNGITYNNQDWNVMAGKATKVKTESDKTLFRALKTVAKITDSSMTKSQKLKICFDYVKSAYTEINPRTPHYRGMDWPVIYANDMFVNGAGNCCSYGAAFAYMAKAIGYENVYCCNSGGHGWAEIDGLVYDPEWSRHRFVYSYYALSYDTKTDNNYKGAIAARYPWMHIKI